jgi:hypothetical protein
MNARVFDKVIEITVNVNDAAHAANDVVCQPVELVGVAQAEGCAIIQSVVITDYDDQGSALDVLFLRSPITVGANNATMTISDGQVDEILGYVSVTSYLDLANNQVGEVRNVGLLIEPDPNDGDSDCSVYMALRTTGTPTYASGHLTVKVGVLRG